MDADGRAAGDSFDALWQDLDRERQTREWTRERLARRASQLSHRPLSEKTLHDRMTQGRRVPWDQVIWIVRALELDEQSWKQRWEQADNSRHRNRSSPQPRAEPNAGPNSSDPTANTASTPMASSSARFFPVSSQFWKSRFATAVSGFFVGVGLTLMIVWAVNMNWFGNDRPAMDCALVSSPTADVFITPDDPEPIFTKRRGDRITLPIDTLATVTASGDRYRLVQTNRAPSGYAYIREDALTPIPC